MAMGEGRREVPDSEDEPMTSSPVDVSDRAADKLFAAAPVPPQDAQDALHEPARSHQAPAESVANLPGDRTDGLEADQENASINTDASKNDQANVQHDITTSGLAHDCDAHIHEITPSDQEGLCHSLPEAGHDTTTEPVITNVDVTDKALLAPEVSIQNDSLQMKDMPGSAPHETTFAHAARSSSDAQQHTHSTNDTAQKPSETERVAIDSFMSEGYRVKEEDDFKSTEPSVARNAMNQPITSQTVGIATPDQTSRPKEGVSVETGSNMTQEAALEKGDDVQPQRSGEDHEMSQEVEHAATPASGPTLKSQTRQDGVDIKMNNANQTQAEEESLSNNTPSLRLDEAAKSVDDTTSRLVQDTIPPNKGREAGMISAQSAGLEQQYTCSAPAPAANEASGGDTNVSAPTDSNSSEAQQGPNPPTSSAITADAQPDAQGHDTTTGIESKSPATIMSSQEITLVELKAQKAALLASLATLPAIQVLMEEKASSGANVSDGDNEPTEADIMAAANKIVKDHIKLLHEYNELKDVGQGLMGLIADQRGVRIIEVQEEFGVDAKD